MKGVRDKFDLAKGEIKDSTDNTASISVFEITREKATKDNYAYIMDGNPWLCVQPGSYVRLVVNGLVMMSDTPMELKTNQSFLLNANGRVLIAGLGIGLLPHNLMNKIRSKEITEVIIIEKHQSVIELVKPTLPRSRCIKVIHADIFNYKPDGLFDTIYFDIWPTIDSDNVSDMNKLNKMYKKHLNTSNSNAWMYSWLEDLCKRMKRQGL